MTGIVENENFFESLVRFFRHTLTQNVYYYLLLWSFAHTSIEYRFGAERTRRKDLGVLVRMHRSYLLLGATLATTAAPTFIVFYVDSLQGMENVL